VLWGHRYHNPYKEMLGFEMLRDRSSVGTHVATKSARLKQGEILIDILKSWVQVYDVRHER